MNFYKFKLFKQLILPVVIAFVSSCANIVTPTGGPKDITAPKVLYCEPQNSTVNFKSKSIRIHFEEFVKLNEISNNLIISPPLKNNPEIKIKGKSIFFEIKDSLKDNTTYTFNFGNSIGDITENNILTNYTYVLSTGSFIDSFSYKGKIVNAQTLKPEKDIFVMLYKENVDSIPLKEIPYYIAKTDLEGNFTFKNLAKSKYKFFALKDLNNNFLFDQIEEQIAFSDTVVVSISTETIKDVSKKDTLQKKDSLKTAILLQKENIFKLFAEMDTSQKVTKTSILEKGKLMIVFKQPTTNIQINSLTPEIDISTLILEKCKSNDTIIYWLPKVEKDSIYLEIRNKNEIIDTLSISLKPPQKRESKKEKLGVKLNLNCSAKNGVNYDYFKSINIEFAHPVSKYNFEKIIFIEEKDTVKPVIGFIDNIQRKLKIDFKLKENINYTLFIPPNTFTDVFNLMNDTLKLTFKTRSKKEYGTLKYKIKLPKNEGSKNFILQMYNSTEKLVSEKFINSSQTVFYDNLEAGVYKMKLIEDENKNKKWDTGIYLKNLQPEKVYFFPESINIKQNWDLDLEWEVLR